MSKTALIYAEAVAVIVAVSVPVHYVGSLEWPWARHRRRHVDCAASADTRRNCCAPEEATADWRTMSSCSTHANPDVK